MGEVTLTGTFTCVSVEDAELVDALLPDHVAATRVEVGCLSFIVERALDPLEWTVAERFIDGAAFRAHQARTRDSEWGRRTAHIARLRALLAPGFVEIGQSGRRWTRDEIVDALTSDGEKPSPDFAMSERTERLLARDAVLLTYLLDCAGRRSRRVSLWVTVDGAAVCEFHQGTTVRVESIN